MVTPRSATPTLEEAILAALAAGERERATVLLRRAFLRAPAAGTDDLPELLEELAEYFATADRGEDALAVAAEALLLTAAEGATPEALRRRCRVAEMLLKMGLSEDACAAYAAAVEEAPDETWVHEAAGSDYIDAGDYEFAFAWLTAGLERAIVNDDDSRCLARLLGLRRMTMGQLGLPLDDLDRRSSVLLDRPWSRSVGDDNLSLLVELDGDGVTPERALRLLEFLRRQGDGA